MAEVSFYDKNEKPVTSRSRGGAVVRYEYDDNGMKREKIVLDASGNVLRTRKYDASGKEVPGGVKLAIRRRATRNQNVELPDPDIPQSHSVLLVASR